MVVFRKSTRQAPTRVEDFKMVNPADAFMRDFKLSLKEQLVGIVLACAVAFALLGATAAVGWSWFGNYGRLTLVVPCVGTFFAWFWYRGRKAMRRASGS